MIMNNIIFCKYFFRIMIAVEIAVVIRWEAYVIYKCINCQFNTFIYIYIFFCHKIRTYGWNWRWRVVKIYNTYQSTSDKKKSFILSVKIIHSYKCTRYLVFLTIQIALVYMKKKCARKQYYIIRHGWLLSNWSFFYYFKSNHDTPSI